MWDVDEAQLASSAQGRPDRFRQAVVGVGGRRASQVTGIVGYTGQGGGDPPAAALTSERAASKLYSIEARLLTRIRRSGASDLGFGRMGRVKQAEHRSPSVRLSSGYQGEGSGDRACPPEQVTNQSRRTSSGYERNPSSFSGLRG
jgi:hypothetical protein